MKNKFKIGVYAADKLPRKFKKPAAFIANTDNHDQAGTHWVAFFIPRHGKPEYFDSYGMYTFIEGHLNFKSKVSKSWLHNKMCMQSLTSNVCGQYCLFFLIARMRDHSMKTFQSVFSKNSIQNDKLVRTCIKNKFKNYCMTKCNAHGQKCCPKSSTS
jgi:hypothetical protein